ncbi:hypothetical protein BDV3_006943 [Batrachochytrium dendrobatidis]
MVQLEGDIGAAYEDVRNDKSATNWLLLEYVDDKTDVLKVAKTGTGGFAEFKQQLGESKASFGYVRQVVGNDELSKRAKFVLSVIKNFAIEISAQSLDDLKDKDIDLLLKKAMGANYDRQTSQY